MQYSPVANGDGMNARPSTNLRRRAGLGSRLAPLIVGLLSTAIGVVPIALQWSNTYFESDTRLYEVSANHRNSVQVVVSVIASILGFLWSFSACSSFNMFMRSWIAKRVVVSVNQLRLTSSVSNNAPDSNLPPWLRVVSFLWFALGTLPALVWTGALTPEAGTAKTMTSNSAMPVSQAGFEGQNIFRHVDGPNRGFTIADYCNGTSANNGTQHSCPGSVFSGRIVDSLRAASSAPGTASLRNHSKLDYSGFNFIGRSYGAGSSVGLFNLPTDNAIYSYSFTERGHVADAKCVTNTSSAWSLDNNERDNQIHPIPSRFTAKGYRPNDDFSRPPTRYATFSFEDHKRMVGFSAGGSHGLWDGTPPFYLSISTGADYSFLNNTQCELDFSPRNFNVTVSPVNKTIQVTQLDPIPGTARGEFFEWTTENLQALAMTQTTLYISTIVEALRDNIQTRIGFPPDVLATAPPSKAMLEAVSDSISAALDDIMLALNGYALTVNVPDGRLGWTTTSATINLSVYRIGTNGWNIAIFVFNLISLALVLFITIWTRLFEGSPAFDFADLTSMVAAAASAAIGSAHGATDSHLTDWRGDAADHALKASVLVFDTKTGKAEVPSVIIRNVDDGGLNEPGYEMTNKGAAGSVTTAESPGASRASAG